MLRISSCAAMATLLLVLGGCGSDDSVERPDQRSRSSSTVEDRSAPDDIASRLACTDTEQLHPMMAPIRSGVAEFGMTCEREGTPLHIFLRHSSPGRQVDPDSFRPYGVYVGVDEEPCADALLVNDDVVIAVPDDAVADAVIAELPDMQFRVVKPTSPPASYALPSGCGEVVATAEG